MLKGQAGLVRGTVDKSHLFIYFKREVLPITAARHTLSFGTGDNPSDKSGGHGDRPKCFGHKTPATEKSECVRERGLLATCLCKSIPTSHMDIITRFGQQASERLE